MIYVLEDEYARLDNKAKFIELVIDKKLVYINRKEEDVIADFEKHGLKRIYPRKKKAPQVIDENDDGEKAQVDELKEKDNSGYEYLFSINVRGFTTQKARLTAD